MYNQIITWKKSCHLYKKEKDEVIRNLNNFILIMSSKNMTEITYNTELVARIVIVDSNWNQSTIYHKKPEYKGIEEKIILTNKKVTAHFFFRRKTPLLPIKQITFFHQI